ncbi:hypothetical protein C1H76_8354 [Elsinoe australis]|uniref:Uncharacterized protein n=1 Tax=Elsinoe australis TaxID=40998 RepID=A0A4U7AR92_9PEZI|nr:hypothetical protein C1H76_8354 [Elsinoe australis]
MSSSSLEPRFQVRRVLGWTTCLLTLVSATALGATLVVLASSDSIPSSNQTLLTVAVVFDMLALLVFAGVAALLLKQLHGRALLNLIRRWMVCAMFWFLSLLAVVLSFAALGAARSSVSKTVPETQKSQLETLSAAAISLCVLFMLFQVVFFATTFVPPKSVQQQFTASGTEGSFSSELKDSPQTQKSRDMFTPVEPLPMSPLTSTFSSTPPRRASIRDSVTNFLQPVIQPMTSKSRLMRQSSFATSISHHSRDDSWGNRAEDAFDTWEVSPVEENPSPIAPPAAYPATRLDPIPASRPPSPAKPLDGPFPHYDDNNFSTASIPIQIPQEAHAVPYPLERKNSLPPHGAVGAVGRKITPPGMHSRQPSSDRRPSLSHRPSTSSENHIHPLFRTESPLPPPTTSPGTIVTASPWGGQIMPPDPAFFTRNGSVSSHPDSPSYMALQFPRPGSAQSGRQGSPMLRTHSAQGAGMSRSGSAQGYPRPGSSQGQGRMRSASTAGQAGRPALRSVRSMEAWGTRRDEGPVNASMPPRMYPGLV